jgi:hypothetical protein
MTERKLPPVTQIGMLSLALIVAGGIYLASHIPGDVPLAPAIILLASSSLLLVGNLVALSRVEAFAWGRFVQVGLWALLAYGVHVPVLIAFTVARYEPVEPPRA